METGKSILVLDDDTGILGLLKIIFEREGYKTFIEPDGNNILNGNFEIPDIFLIDRNLSYTDGTVVCAHLKNAMATRNIPVILFSATPGIGMLAKTAGADDFIEKPFKIAELLQIVRQHLSTSCVDA